MVYAKDFDLKDSRHSRRCFSFSVTEAFPPWPLCHRMFFNSLHWTNATTLISGGLEKVALMALVGSYKAARDADGTAIYLLALNLNPARLISGFLLPSYLCVLTSDRKAFTFSWARLCATGVAPVINIAAPVGSGSFKIVFLRPSHWNIYYVSLGINKKLHTVH